MQFASKGKLLINSKCEKKYVLKPFSKSLKLVPSTLQLIVLKILVLTFHLLGKSFGCGISKYLLSKYELNNATNAMYRTTQYINHIKVLDPPISRHSTDGRILFQNPQHQHPIEQPLFWFADNFSLPFIMAKIQMVFLIAAFPPFQVFTLKIPFSKWPSG